MKIAEMTTISFADFINAAGDHVGNIVQNESFTNLFKEENMDNRIMWLINAAKVICGPCREDIFAILSAFCGKSIEEIEKQNLLVTIGMIRDIYNDIKDVDIPE